MTEQAGQDTGFSPEDADPSWRALHRLATIAWMAIALGLIIQALILAGKQASGGSLPGPPILADMAHGVTWSLIACLGVGIGAMVMRASLTLASLIGFVAAPTGLGGIQVLEIAHAHIGHVTGYGQGKKPGGRTGERCRCGGSFGREG